MNQISYRNCHFPPAIVPHAVWGFVTNLKIGCNESLDSIGSRTDRYRLSPPTNSVVSSFAMLGWGDQMATGVEDVADGGMD